MNNKLRSITGSQRFWMCIQISIVILCIIYPKTFLNVWLTITGKVHDPEQGLGLLMFAYLFYCIAGIIIIYDSTFINKNFGCKIQFTLFNIVIPIWYLVKFTFLIIFKLLALFFNSIREFNSFLNKNM